MKAINQAYIPVERPSDCPAPIAKVEGDSVIMAQVFNQRRADEWSAELVDTRFPYVLTYSMDETQYTYHENRRAAFSTLGALYAEIIYFVKHGGRGFAASFDGQTFNIAGFIAEATAPVVELTGQFELDGKTYHTDSDTIGVLRSIMPSAKESGDASAVAALMELGLQSGCIVEVPHLPCGTCEGEGHCPDCNTMTIEEAQERLADLNRGLLYAVLPKIASQYNDAIAEIQSYIARQSSEGVK